MKVVTDPKKQQRKIKHMHSGPDGSLESESTGGHSGMNKTRQKLTRRYYWKGMAEDIKEYIRTCDKCQRKKTIQLQKTQVTMRSIPIPQKIFSQIGIDLVTMPPSQGYKYILTVCDFFTKWPELIPIQDKKATTIARELYLLFTRYGCPDVIISDRGTEFCNAVSEAIFTYMRVEHRVSVPYHPQTNGKKTHKCSRNYFIELSYKHNVYNMVCPFFSIIRYYLLQAWWKS